MDRLGPLLAHLAPGARVFHVGTLAGVAEYVPREAGVLHLLRSGTLEVEDVAGRRLLAAPALLFYTRGIRHRLRSTGAALVCAEVGLDGPAAGPVVEVLPPVMALSLDVFDGAEGIVECIAAEADGDHCGRTLVLGRLLEVLLLLALRQVLDAGLVERGLLAGLSDPQLARALTRMHEAPDHPWTVAALAREAGMSRTRFATAFRERVGEPPLRYLARWRMGLARTLLLAGEPIQRVAPRVGYADSATFVRAFARRVGRPPRVWLREARRAPVAAAGDDRPAAVVM